MPATPILFPVLALVAVAVAGRLTWRSWLHPGAFFALCWSFIVILSLSGPLFGAEQYPVWHGTLWWIVLVMVCVYAGSAIGSQMASPPRVPTPIPGSGRLFDFVTPLLIVSATGSVVWPIAVPQLTTFGDHPPLYLQVFLGLHYLAPFLGGILLAASRETRYRLLSIAALLPGIFLAVIDTGRSKIIGQVTTFFISYFAMLVFLHRSRPVPLFTMGRTLAGAVSIVLLVAIGVAFTTFRSVPWNVSVEQRITEYWHRTDSESIRRDWEWMQPSIFGHVAMFSAYFELAWANPPLRPKFPEQTAAGIHRALGGEPGEVLMVDVGGLPSNVFTIFKPPIEDFTMPGSLLVFFAWAIVSGWAYRKVQLGALWPMALLIFYYGNVTNVGGIFLAYNSITGAYLLTGLYLWYLETHGSLRSAPALAAPGTPARPVWGTPRTLGGER